MGWQCLLPLFILVRHHKLLRLFFLGSLSPDPSRMVAAIEAYTPVYGDQFSPEDSMGALLVAAKSNAVGWRSEAVANGQQYVKVVVLITDATYRSPKDRTPPRVCPEEPFVANNGSGENYDTRHVVSQAQLQIL